MKGRVADMLAGGPGLGVAKHLMWDDEGGNEAQRKV